MPPNPARCKFVLDTSVYIQAARFYYAFDIVPGFWDFLKSLIRKEHICSPTIVLDEIRNGQSDALKTWTDRHAQELFLPQDMDTNIIQAYVQISNYVVANYEDHHAKAFLDTKAADPWVVATAKAYNLVVVHMEIPKNENRDPNTKKIRGRVKIPNVCDHLGIDWLNTYDFLRLHKLQFHYKP